MKKCVCVPSVLKGLRVKTCSQGLSMLPSGWSVAQQLRATHMAAFNHLTLLLGDLVPSSRLRGYCMHVVHLYTHRKNTHKIKINKVF